MEYSSPAPTPSSPAGTRIILIATQGMCQVLPPAAALLTQAVCAFLTFNSRAYCTTPLLRHPLTQQRLGAAAAGLEYLAAPLGALLPGIGR